YTSNVFAILGLRSLYFALAHIIDRFKYLSVGLSVILIFVGLKMVMVDIYKVEIHHSLIFIISVLITSVIFSVLRTGSKKN
ncbi:MAG: TerC family protein, partial [Bacteroidota bacterium]